MIFADDGEWAAHLCVFVRGGLEQGERIHYFADATDPERVVRALTDAGIDAVAAVRRGRLFRLDGRANVSRRYRLRSRTR
ncbi:hypothetical protein SGLAM104S_00252 [Streptomyces glaucescens]